MKHVFMTDSDGKVGKLQFCTVVNKETGQELNVTEEPKVALKLAWQYFNLDFTSKVPEPVLSACGQEMSIGSLVTVDL
jgi:hypothetical protein